jgi:hypothetical protein
MLNWMARTWWVNLAFGALVALGLAVSNDQSWDLGRYGLVLLQVAVAGGFFFEAGILWTRRTRSNVRDSSQVT